MSDKLKVQLITGVVLVSFGFLIFASIAQPIAQGANIAMIALSPTYRAQWEAEQRALMPIRAIGEVAGLLLGIVTACVVLGVIALLALSSARYIAVRTELQRYIAYPHGDGLPAIDRRLGEFYVPGTRNATAALPVDSVMPVLQDSFDSTFQLDRYISQGKLERLVIGKTESGQVVTDSLYNMMHVLTVSASGFGKSTFLMSLLWQIATCHEKVDVSLIDVMGSEFNILEDWNRLEYPIARNESEAAAILAQLTSELDIRKSLYRECPMANSLDSYNRNADNPLSPKLCVIDEGLILLGKEGITSHLQNLIAGARQYGIYCVVTAQSAKHTILPTQIRDSFSTRLGLHTSARSLNVVFDAALRPPDSKGVAWYTSPGNTPQLLKVPYVDRETFYTSLERGNNTKPLSIIENTVVDDDTLSREERAKLLHTQGVGISEIALRLWGSTGGNAYYAAKAAIGT
jgi:hypothetical protein